MDGHAGSLRWFEDVKRVEVPFFQRPYVWSDEDFNALIESFDQSEKGMMPFFGSFILKKQEDKRFQIIDGQQRLTTFCILIRALLDINNARMISPQITSTIEIHEKSIIYEIRNDNPDGIDEYQLKLTPSNNDESAFNRIMDPNCNRPLDVQNLNDNNPIEHAYKYFYKKFSQEKLQSVRDYLVKIQSQNYSLIYIILDENDDEQRIFDSVNSLGKSLTNADIIKNYLFQKMRDQAGNNKYQINQVSDSYSRYWEDIFYSDDRKSFWYKDFTIGRIKTNSLECFFKDFAIIKGFYHAKQTPGVYGLCKAYKAIINNGVFSDFHELHGDRLHGDDSALIGGVGRLNGRPVTILATNKGRDMAEGQATHFGGVSPDGYRKAIRLMKQSTKFNRPIVALINTPGAYPGVEAEYGGQGEAIARSIQTGLGQPVPYLSLIFGEAGSGGALALATGDEVWMLEKST